MILTTISVILIAACLVGIVRIIGRHSHVLSSIDVSAIPEEQHAKVKDALILQRLKRKFSILDHLMHALAEPLMRFANALQERVRSMHGTLLRIRSDYAHRGIVGGTRVSEENLPFGERMALLSSRADAALADEKLKDAEDNYIKMIALEKKHIPAYEGLVRVYAKRKEYDHASELLEVLCKLKNDAVKLEADPEKKIELECALAEMHHEFFDTALVADKLDDALKSIKKAVKLQGNNPKYLHSLVDVYVRLGMRLKAEQALDRLRDANPENQKLGEIAEKIAELSY